MGNLAKIKYSLADEHKMDRTKLFIGKFCNHHRSWLVNLEEAKNHVDFQLPTDHTRVGYLIDNITNTDPDLHDSIANIRQNVSKFFMILKML